MTLSVVYHPHIHLPMKQDSDPYASLHDFTDHHEHKLALQELALKIDAATSMIGSTKAVVQSLEDLLVSRYSCISSGLEVLLV